MEKMPNQHNIVGKELNEGKIDSAKKFIDKKIEEGKTLNEDEVEKDKSLEKMVNVANHVIEKELTRLEVDAQQVPSVDSVHFFDRQSEGTPSKPVFKANTQEIQVENIQNKSMRDSIADKLANFTGKSGTSSVRYSNFQHLLHEMIHAHSHLKHHADVEDRKIKPYRAGYSVVNSFGDEVVGKMSLFNEGVVQRMTEELLTEEDDYLTKTLNFSKKEKEQFLKGKDRAYVNQVDLMKNISKNIALHDNTPEEEVWDTIKRGHFTGEMMHLRKIDEVYGEGSLRLLGLMDTIKKEEDKEMFLGGLQFEQDIAKYFSENNLEENKKILKKYT